VSSPTSPLAELLADLARALEALGVRWYLFGAQAAILYGVARLTADVDVTVQAGSRSTREIVAGLEAAGCMLRVADVEAFVERTRVLPLVHARTRIPVDVVLAGPGLEELFLARVEEHVVAGVRLPVVSAEDLVVMKILAGRPKDLDDAETVVTARRGRLDRDRIRATLELLEKALDRADLVAELDRILGSGDR
jgi:hypothetical protein